MSELPVGWATFSIADIGGVSGGKTPSKSNAAFWASRDVPWVSPKDMKRLHLAGAEDHISKASLSEASMVLYPINSILMVTRSGILQHSFPVAMADVPLTVNQDIKVIAPRAEIDPSFLLHELRAFGQTILQQCSKAGTTVQSIDSEKLEKLPLPLPPLAEQKCIAQKLDAMLAQVDTLKARIDAIPSALKRFRRSALSNLMSKSDQPGRENWGSVSIGNLCVAAFDGPFGSKLKSDDYADSGIRVVRLENIGHLYFIEEKATYVSFQKGEELSKNRLSEGDILFSSFVDEEIRVCQLPASDEAFINKADCFCLRVDPQLADAKFLALALSSQTTYERIKESVHGATRPRINLGFLKSFEIDLPSVAEQTEIVRRVEQLFAFADQLEAKVATAKQRIDMLTQSILAKAFRGELVPQDPNDEPASVLLERIRAQRAATPKPKRGREPAANP